MIEDASSDNMPHPFRAGIKAALGAPALGLFVALMGYGALNKGIGIDFAVMWSAVFLIWSMPALMTFSELALSGAGLWAMFIAVIFSNLRNIPMVVTALPLVRAERGLKWKDLLFAQLLSPTVWVHILVRAQNLPLNARRAFFTAFALTVFVSALAGATVGYFGIGAIPAALGIALLILTPLYLLLIMVSVRKLSSYLALGIGAVAVPWLMQWSVEWGLALGGIGAGTLGFLLGGGHKRRGRQ
ncbi:MAG: AzlC family ABC transporter permease [Rhodospirillaceae bacterium]|jgi:hypothetical protein|nr:AzlC family ABC transporter permease [Rhodospirillaceae bacterium]